MGGHDSRSSTSAGMIILYAVIIYIGSFAVFAMTEDHWRNLPAPIVSGISYIYVPLVWLLYTFMGGGSC